MLDSLLGAVGGSGDTQLPINKQIEIKVGGTALKPEQMNLVLEVVVDQQAHLPAMFTIRFDDPKMELLDSKKFDLTKEVEISGISPADEKAPLIKGEITALEPQFLEGNIFVLVIRGYDKAHRLFRETRSEAYLNKKYSDLATEFARKASLSPEVDATATVYDHIYQDNETDLAFLMRLAWRVGYECFVDDGKLHFRKPPKSSAKTKLVWGEDLSSFHPSMTLAEQVDSVEARGWDPKTLKAIVGQAKKGTLYPDNEDSKDGAKWATSFGTGKRTFVDIPFVSQAAADKFAQARLDEYSGAYFEAEGMAVQKPEIKAGGFVEIDRVGRLNGTYRVTQATHSFRNDRLTTKFRICGARTGLLSEQMARQEPVKRWPGVATAVVTNTDDPDGWGRVKVQYPWMSEDAESFWARLSGPGAGPEAGFIAIPAVDDEVLVAFEHGDINYPVILGGLWNGKHAPPPPTAGGVPTQLPLIRTWQSINGHVMAMYDDDVNNKIEIQTAAGHIFVLDDVQKKVEIQTAAGHIVVLDDLQKVVEVKTSTGHTITMDDKPPPLSKVTVKSMGSMELNAMVDLQIIATSALSLKAPTIALAGQLSLG